jgi:hypothetical protein
VARAGLQVFQLTAGNVLGDEMAEIFAKTKDKKLAVAADNKAPFIAKGTASGKVHVVFGHQRLRRYLR